MTINIFFPNQTDNFFLEDIQSRVPESVRALLTDFPKVAVHNSHHTAAATAELAIGLLLAAARLIIPSDHALRTSKWTIPPKTGKKILLEGKTVLLLGYGHVGKRVARVCNSFGMSVIAIRRRLTLPDKENDQTEICPLYMLEDLLPRAQAMIITLPLTTETKGIIGDKELDRLPTGAILVNVGRGPIIKEKALFDSLVNGKIGSAGLDVWYNYPPDSNINFPTEPSNYPFNQLENVVMSPHQGSETEETLRIWLEELGKDDINYIM